jgi:hypothetical protein
MEWSQPCSTHSGNPGLWGMADAGPEHVTISRTSATEPIGWFQVIPLNDGQPLPVQPLIVCALDALNRLGDAKVASVCLGAPLSKHSDRASGLLSGLNWFMHVPPDSGVHICADVTLHAADVPDYSMGDLAASVGDWDIEPFGVITNAVGHQDRSRASISGRELPGLGSVVDRVCFRAPEWSAESIAWVAAVLVDNAHRLRFRHHMLASLHVQPMRAL